VRSRHYSDLAEAWSHCKKWSKSIELFYHNEQDQKVLAKVHFRSYPAVSVTHYNVNPCVLVVTTTQDELPEEIIEKVKYRVNRESAEDKVRDFLNWMKAIKKEIHHLVYFIYSF